MKISEKGKEIIKEFEGFNSKAYTCTAGKLTIGYGHVINENESYLKNKILNKDEAGILLDKDIERFNSYLNNITDKYNIKLTQNQFDALVSFCFNTGYFSNNMINRFKRKDKKAIGDAIILYNKAAGKAVEGLTKRRKKEQQLYFS